MGLGEGTYINDKYLRLRGEISVPGGLNLCCSKDNGKVRSGCDDKSRGPTCRVPESRRGVHGTLGFRRTSRGDRQRQRTKYDLNVVVFVGHYVSDALS